jgi:RES domain
MAEFESWKQYWEFSHFVMRKARHRLDAKNQRFLDAVVETSAKRKGSIQKGAVLWRAQLGNDWRTERVLDENREEIDAFDVENPFSPGRMTPLQDRANEGRVNPKGIPCLYFSTDRDTAMAETRPWIGSHVSVAQFVMLRDLSVVDCSADSARRGVVVFGKDREPEPAKREELVWGSINRAFSEPVTRIDDVAEYAPTQVLAEAFRNAGYDGIACGSKLGTGTTVAIFDLAAAELANCHLYKVEAVSLKFSMTANPYYVEKYCKTEAPKGSADPVSGSESQKPLE